MPINQPFFFSHRDSDSDKDSSQYLHPFFPSSEISPIKIPAKVFISERATDTEVEKLIEDSKDKKLLIILLKDIAFSSYSVTKHFLELLDALNFVDHKYEMILLLRADDKGREIAKRLTLEDPSSSSFTSLSFESYVLYDESGVLPSKIPHTAFSCRFIDLSNYDIVGYVMQYQGDEDSIPNSVRDFYFESVLQIYEEIFINSILTVQYLDDHFPFFFDKSSIKKLPRAQAVARCLAVGKIDVPTRESYGIELRAKENSVSPRDLSVSAFSIEPTGKVKKYIEELEESIPKIYHIKRIWETALEKTPFIYYAMNNEDEYDFDIISKIGHILGIDIMIDAILNDGVDAQDVIA